jgi:hypothetical protein
LLTAVSGALASSITASLAEPMSSVNIGSCTVQAGV